MPILYTIGRKEPQPRRTYPYSLILLGVCVVIFILQLAAPVITTTFWLDPSVALLRPWMFITSMFLHGGFTHLFYNMFALGLFGFILEKIIGARKFITLYFIAGIVGGFAYLVLSQDMVPAIGASGAIMGVLGCLAVLRPRMSVWVMGVPMPMMVAAGMWILLDLAGFVSQSTGIANAAHLGGMFLGIAYGFWIRKRFAEPQRKPGYRISNKQLDDWENKYM